jgi:glycosyltransferase involved in cell wall biosynthesis
MLSGQEDPRSLRCPRLSVVITTLNEENNMRGCLESIKWVDEIVIIDSGSSDRTVEICKEYTDKVFQAKLGFADAFNLGIRKTRGEWILPLGADERVTTDLRREIEIAIRDHKYDGYFIPRKNIVLGKWIKGARWYPAYQLRLFKRGKGYFSDREVHESIILHGKKGKLNNPLIHLCVPTVMTAWKKYDLYTTLEVRQKVKEGEKFSVCKFLSYPFMQFIYRFFLEGGFRDGCHGFFVSMNYAFYEFIEQAKFWEYTLKSSDNHLY